MVESAIPDQDAGEFEQTEIVLDVAFPADQDAATGREPSQRPLYYPPPRRMAPRARRPLVTDQGDVGDVVVVDA